LDGWLKGEILFLKSGIGGGIERGRLLWPDVVEDPDPPSISQ